MDKRMAWIFALTALIGLLMIIVLWNINQPATQPETMPTYTQYFESGMQRFPSYDWEAEDHYALAFVIANTPGTNKQKQETVINILNQIWSSETPITIEEFVNKHYVFYHMPTANDYALIDMIISGKWAED